MQLNSAGRAKSTGHRLTRHLRKSYIKHIVNLAAVFKMAVLRRRPLHLDKSYFLVSLVQKSLVTKAAAAGNEKIDKKIRRKEERKEM